MRLLQFQLKYSCVCSAWSLLELLIVLALMAILASLKFTLPGICNLCMMNVKN